ncbi:DoxX family protein [Candidatus Woesearchaeota archaeon]|nr:DoxX family protein [Candidatus Woesearchaeota archaeon]
MAKNSRYGPAILRVFLGLLFIVPGITKLMNPAGIIGLVGKIGFPIAPIFGWIVIISELVCGAALIAGYKLKYAVWPLVVIMGVAAVAVYLPCGCRSLFAFNQAESDNFPVPSGCDCRVGKFVPYTAWSVCGGKRLGFYSFEVSVAETRI